MHSIISIMFGWKMCSKFSFTSIFLILTNFAAFLHHTKENADVTKNDGYFLVNFYICRKYMPEAFSTPNLVALPITSQELDRGCFLTPPPTKIGLSNSPTTIGLTRRATDFCLPPHCRPLKNNGLLTRVI